MAIVSSSLHGKPVPMLDFARQFAPMREEILGAIASVCEAQNFILGPAVASFEAEAARVCGAADAFGCASGTDALWLALAAARIGDSASAVRAETADRVITSPFSFFATASAILRAGARPVFADIDPRTFNLSPGSVTRLLDGSRNSRPRAILPVHLYGQCAEMDAFATMRREIPELLVIEDAAQAFGAMWNGTPAGSLGDVAAFSFYPTKNLAAIGDAGLLTTSNPAIAGAARSLRSHGMTRRYFHDEVGWNSRMDSIQAAVLSIRLRHLPKWNDRRRELAARYDRLFRQSGLAAPDGTTCPEEGLVLPWTDPRATPVFHQYVIRAARRDALREHLAERAIASEIYYPVPLHLQQALAGLGYRRGDLPEAERAAAEVLALPIFPELREDEQDRVVDGILSFYR
jgi:dTDP-4-amino-4,6-dideoxygalactose transaminase